MDGTCTSNGWVTLGKGLVLQPITTDEKGTGREELFRPLPSPVGSQFDIHFHVIDTATKVVVLESSCYQFTISM